jgi:hypothetical protein
MTTHLKTEYRQWKPWTKLELINGKFYIGDSLTHSRLLLSQIIRGWGLEAVISLAPEHFWWQALTSTFQAPLFNNSDKNNLKNLRTWSRNVQFKPEKIPFLIRDNWASLLTRQALRTAFFEIARKSQIDGDISTGGWINRLGNHGVMPEIALFKGLPRNQMNQCYLNGSAELIIEVIESGCEDYIYDLKFPIYQQEQVLELWTINYEQKRWEFFRLSEGKYQQQNYSLEDGYSPICFPEITIFPEEFWSYNHSFIKKNSTSLGTYQTEYGEPEVDFTRKSLPFKLDLDPVYINFDDYILWCPDPKFEFINGRPYVGGREGTKGLIGLLLMTFGLKDVVTLAHPQQWMKALLKQREKAKLAVHQTEAWQLASQIATFLKDHCFVEKIAVAGDLVTASGFSFWSELILVVWGVQSDSTKYTSLREIINQLSPNLPISLIIADRELTEIQSYLIAQGIVDL